MNIKKIVKNSLGFPSKIYHKFLFYFCNVQAGKNINIRGRLYIKNSGEVIIEDNVRINSSSTSNPIGSGDRTYFQVLPNAKLTIGANTGISNTAFTCMQSISIGKNVIIGAGCKIYDTDFHPIYFEDRLDPLKKDNLEYISHAPIKIHNDVFIGAGSFILKGVEIGKGSVVGAGSVVTKSIPTMEIWGGNPAKKIGDIENKK